MRWSTGFHSRECPSENPLKRVAFRIVKNLKKMKMFEMFKECLFFRRVFKIFNSLFKFSYSKFFCISSNDDLRMREKNFIRRAKLIRSEFKRPLQSKGPKRVAAN